MDGREGGREGGRENKNLSQVSLTDCGHFGASIHDAHTEEGGERGLKIPKFFVQI